MHNIAFRKLAKDARNLLEIQKDSVINPDGSLDGSVDAYQHGLYNGMELILAHFEKRNEQVF